MLPRIYTALKQNPFVPVLVLIAAAYLLLRAWYVLVIVFIAFILTVALLPLVDLLNKRMPRSLAIAAVYVSIVSLASGLGYLLFPPLVEQLDLLTDRLPDTLERLPFVDAIQVDQSLFSYLRDQVSGLQQLALTVTDVALTVLLAVVAIFVVSIYWLADYRNIRQGIVGLFGPRSGTADRVFRNVEQRMGSWVRGQLLLSTAVGVLSLIAYLIIGLPAAVPLALLAAALEVVPMLGPILAAVPAILFAFTISPKTALVTLAALIAIQQIEGNLLAPKIMARVTNLHPLGVLLLLLVGGELGGLVGILLAVPLALFIVAIRKGLQQGGLKKKATAHQ